MNNHENPAAEAQQEAAQTSDPKAEATSSAKASDELSENDLAAVAGGRRSPGTGPAPDPRVVLTPPVFPV
jgi:hypothetical protein